MVRADTLNERALTRQTVTSAEAIVQREDKDGIAFVVLNRPQARNALSAAMLEALSQDAGRYRDRQVFRAVIVAANGPAFLRGTRSSRNHRTPQGSRRRPRLHEIPDGFLLRDDDEHPSHATARHRGGRRPGERSGLPAGRELRSVDCVEDRVLRHAGRSHRPVLLDADGRAVAQRHPETRDGNAADRRTGRGRRRPIASAWSIAWSTRGTARDEAFKLARRITAKSALTIKLGKEAFYRQLDMTLPEAYRYTGEVMVENMMARDAEEGISAFVEKRSTDLGRPLIAPRSSVEAR